jgi:hypothetical protein
MVERVELPVVAVSGTARILAAAKAMLEPHFVEAKVPVVGQRRFKSSTSGANQRVNSRFEGVSESAFIWITLFFQQLMR